MYYLICLKKTLLIPNFKSALILNVLLTLEVKISFARKCLTFYLPELTNWGDRRSLCTTWWLGTGCVDQAGFKAAPVPLSLPPQCWNQRLVPPRPAQDFFVFESWLDEQSPLHNPSTSKAEATEWPWVLEQPGLHKPKMGWGDSLNDEVLTQWV